MQEIDFFRTPFFLFKADENFAEKISDEIEDIVKGRQKVDYINYFSGDNKNSVPLPSVDFNINTSVGGFLNNEGNLTSINNIPSKIRNHIIENIQKIPLHLKFGEIWYNITSNKDYNRCHNHKEVDLVFVVYLTKGTLWIQNPNERVKLDRFFNRVGSSISIDFNIGDMIVFPSDISHWVEPHEEKYDRVTIAGNLDLNVVYT